MFTDWDCPPPPPDLPEVLPEVPAWLLEAPASDEPPGCDCGCSCVPATTANLSPTLSTSVSSSLAAVPVTALSASTADVPALERAAVRWAVPGVWDDQPKPSPDGLVRTVGRQVAQLRTLLIELARIEPVTLPAGQALGEAEALHALVSELRVLLLSRTEDVMTRRLFDPAGYRSTAAWWRTVAPDTPAGDRTLARRLTDLPHLHTALREGRVSVTAASRAAQAIVALRPGLDRPDGMIDGQPGEPVLAAVGENVVELISRDRCGLSEADPNDQVFLDRLDATTAAITVSGTSQRDRIEQHLVLLTQHLSPSALPAALEEITLALLPSLLEERERSAQAKRALALTANEDGTWTVTGTLTPECGEQLFTALAAEARRDPANPIDTQLREQHRLAGQDQRPEQEHTASHKDHPPTPTSPAGTVESSVPSPDGPGWSFLPNPPPWEQQVRRRDPDIGDVTGELVPRSPSKRTHDALARLLSRYLSTGLGGVHGKVPVQVTATISSRTLEGLPGSPPARSGTGRPIARSVLRRWWCDAQVTTLLLSRGWTPLGVVHTARTVTGTELTALRVQQDQRCAGLDCCGGTPNPLIPLVPHHITRYAVSGTTSSTDTLLICERLHQDMHLGKRTIRLRNGRLVTESGYLEDR